MFKIFFPHLGWAFSICSAYQSLLVQLPRVPWHRLVWSNYGILAHMFIFWLAVRERLSIIDSINLYLFLLNRCFLCKAEAENHKNLFFDCAFSRQVLQCFRRLKKFRWPRHRWETGVSWVAARWREKGPWQMANRLTLHALV